MRYAVLLTLAMSLAAPAAHAQDASLWRGCGEFEAYRIWLLGADDFDEAATADCNIDMKPAELIAGCTRVIERSSDPDVRGDAVFNRALARVTLSDLDGAMSDLNRLLPSDTDSDAYDMRGVVRYCDGDLTGALTDLNAALAVWPENEVALADRARVYLAQGDIDRALADAERAADLEPEHETAFAIMGVAHESKGNAAAAAEAYDMALENEFWCDCGAIDIDAVEAAYDRVGAATK